MVIRKRFDSRSALPGSPFLTHVTLREDRVQAGVHPFTVPWLLPSLDLQLSAPVTFLVGENGTGKSTLLEAIAWSVGFGAQGGNRDQSFAENADGYALGRALRLSWRQKVSGGFFLRAETFFNFATYLEDVGSPFIAYGGKSLHQQSHGEAFLSLFQHRFEDGLYLLDEPEAALSPQRQLAFLRTRNQQMAGATQDGAPSRLLQKWIQCSPHRDRFGCCRSLYKSSAKVASLWQRRALLCTRFFRVARMSGNGHRFRPAEGPELAVMVSSP